MNALRKDKNSRRDQSGFVLAQASEARFRVKEVTEADAFAGLSRISSHGHNRLGKKVVDLRILLLAHLRIRRQAAALQNHAAIHLGRIVLALAIRG